MTDGQDEAARHEEDGTELYVNRLIQDHLSQAITRKLLRKEPAKEETLRMLVEDVKLVKCRMQASTAQVPVGL